MENTLQKYLSRTDLIKAIHSVDIVQGTAKDSGNVYYCVELSFINGYKKRLFLRSDELFAWTNAFDMVESHNQVDINFN